MHSGDSRPRLSSRAQLESTAAKLNRSHHFLLPLITLVIYVEITTLSKVKT
jgi:hypothetical protein